MIGRLRGELIQIEGNLALVDVGGVGYEISVPLSVLPDLPAIGEEAILLIRQIFREDSVSLYGFSNAYQRNLFDLLLEVKGCGPKVVLSLLGTLDPDVIAQAIQLGDSQALSRAQGVGARLAERIALELKDKIQEHLITRRVQTSTRRPMPIEDELVSALVALGYRRTEAEVAADSARNLEDPLEDQLRSALSVLRK